MFNKFIICSFILFLFVIIIEHFIRGGTILEGLDSSSSDIGVTVGTYGAKLDSLGKIVDSMQSNVLGLLPVVTKNASDNKKNSEAIQAIIENKDKI